MIHIPWLFIAGCAMVGFLIPEFIIVLSPRSYEHPIALSYWTAVAFGFIAASVSL